MRSTFSKTIYVMFMLLNVYNIQVSEFIYFIKQRHLCSDVGNSEEFMAQLDLI